MKKIFAAVLLSFAIASPAIAGDTPFYAGVSLGSTSLPSTSTTALGIFVGYKFDKSDTPFMGDVGTLAVEGQYTTLGSDNVNAGFPGNSFTATDNYYTLGVDVVAMFPIKPVKNLSVFGKLGFNNVNANSSCIGTGVYAGTTCSYSASSGINLGIGAGAQYEINRDFAVRAGYQSYSSSISTVYAAGIYNF